MRYSCLEELQVSLSLNLSDKTKILSDAGCRYNDNWFIVTDDGNCHLFDNDGNLDDIAKVKWLDKTCIKRDIKKINVPCGVTSIGDYVFTDCSKLMNVMIPDNVTSIGNGAFKFCSSLISITIPNSVTSIGDFAFRHCNRLTNVTIPDGVTSIGDYAFYNCSSLMSVTIPDSMTSIGYNAFMNCNNFNKIVFKGKTLEEVQSMKNYPFGLKIHQ